MGASRKSLMLGGAAFAVAGLVLSPAITAARGVEESPAKLRVLLSARGGIGSFTPAAADPKLAAVLARSDLSSAGFRFTPAGESGKPRQVTVAVRARTTRVAQASFAGRPDLPAAPSLGLTPSAYNLGASVGWKRFALSGDMARIDTGIQPGSRETISAGASYNASRWSGRVQIGSDRGIGDQPSLLGPERSYSLDVGGSYSITRNLNVTAGVRYRKDDRDRLQPMVDDRRDSQAVYIGTAFKF